MPRLARARALGVRLPREAVPTRVASPLRDAAARALHACRVLPKRALWAVVSGGAEEAGCEAARRETVQVIHVAAVVLVVRHVAGVAEAGLSFARVAPEPFPVYIEEAPGVQLNLAVEYGFVTGEKGLATSHLLVIASRR